MPTPLIDLDAFNAEYDAAQQARVDEAQQLRDGGAGTRALPVVGPISTGVQQGATGIAGAMGFAGSLVGIPGAAELNDLAQSRVGELGRQEKVLDPDTLGIASGVAKTGTELVVPAGFGRASRAIPMLSELNRARVGVGIGAGLMAGGAAEHQAEASGLTGWDKAAFVAKQASIEAGMSAFFGMGGAEALARGAREAGGTVIARVLSGFGEEVREETITEALQKWNEWTDLPENRAKPFKQVHDEFMAGLPQLVAISGIVGGGSQALAGGGPQSPFDALEPGQLTPEEIAAGVSTQAQTKTEPRIRDDLADLDTSTPPPSAADIEFEQEQAAKRAANAQAFATNETLPDLAPIELGDDPALQTMGKLPPDGGTGPVVIDPALLAGNTDPAYVGLGEPTDEDFASLAERGRPRPPTAEDALLPETATVRRSTDPNAATGAYDAAADPVADAVANVPLGRLTPDQGAEVISAWLQQQAPPATPTEGIGRVPAAGLDLTKVGGLQARADAQARGEVPAAPADTEAETRPMAPVEGPAAPAEEPASIDSLVDAIAHVSLWKRNRDQDEVEAWKQTAKDQAAALGITLQQAWDQHGEAITKRTNDVVAEYAALRERTPELEGLRQAFRDGKSTYELREVLKNELGIDLDAEPEAPAAPAAPTVDEAQAQIDAKAKPITSPQDAPRTLRPRSMPEGPDGPDILNAIAEEGGIASRPRKKRPGAGEYDGAPRTVGLATRLFGGSSKPDQMAAILQSRGIGDGTVNTMWLLVEKALERRAGAKKAAKRDGPDAEERYYADKADETGRTRPVQPVADPAAEPDTAPEVEGEPVAAQWDRSDPGDRATMAMERGATDAEADRLVGRDWNELSPAWQAKLQGRENSDDVVPFRLPEDDDRPIAVSDEAIRRHLPPGTTVTRTADGGYRIDAPGGAYVEVHPVDSINAGGKGAAGAMEVVVNEKGEAIGANVLLTRGRATAGTWTHELVHVLRALGLIRPAEWRALIKAYATPARMTELRKRYGHLRAFQGMSPAKQNEYLAEEAIAEQFQEWTDTNTRPEFGSMWDRVAAWLRDMAAAMGFEVDRAATSVARDVQSGALLERTPKSESRANRDYDKLSIPSDGFMPRDQDPAVKGQQDLLAALTGAAEKLSAAADKIADAATPAPAAPADWREDVQRGMRKREIGQQGIFGDDAGTGTEGQERLFSIPDDQPRLRATHNITAEQLVKAAQLGGLPVPSIAVAPEDHAIHEGYGEVTLIGGKDLADPAKEPVFDADAYTPTFPRRVYRKARTAVAQKLVDSLRPTAKRFDDGHAVDMLWERLVNEADPERAADDLLRSATGRAAFLAEKGVKVEPVMRATRPRLTIHLDPEVRAVAASIDWRRMNDVATDDPWAVEQRQRLGRAMLAAVERDDLGTLEGDDRAALIESRVESLRKHRISDGDELISWAMHELNADIANAGKQEVDRGDTREALEAAIKGREAEFQAWVENKVLPLGGEPRMKLGRRTVPFTLENVVEHMTSPADARAQEKGMTFGDGAARAAAATRFPDLEAMRSAAKNIRPEHEVNASRDHAKKLLDEYRSGVLDHYGETDWRGNRDTWRGLDASMKALARWAKGRHTPVNLQAALRREGFGNVPAKALAKGVEAGKAFLAAPVPYFEAKPQRAVALSEFPVAVVPNDAKPEVRAVLAKAGVEVREYDPRTDGDRARVVREATSERDLRFSLPAEKGPVWRFKSETVVDSPKFPSKASGDAMLAALRNAGVNERELYWTGLDTLKGQKAVTKEQVRALLAAPKVKLGENVSGFQPEVPTWLQKRADDLKEAKADVERRLSERYREEYKKDGIAFPGNVTGGTFGEAEIARGRYESSSARSLVAEYTPWSPEMAALIREGIEIGRNHRNTQAQIRATLGPVQTRYDEYALPGGKNYRELLITMPEERGATDRYASAHWPGVNNPLLHVRFNERMDTDGKRVLHVEEIQSDWHQAGRDRGYRMPGDEKAKDAKAMKLRVLDLHDTARSARLAYERRTGGEAFPVVIEDGDGPDGESSAFMESPEGKEWRAAIDEARKLEDQTDGVEEADRRKVPYAPFDKTWEEIGLRRMIRWAAEHGFERLTWATGEQQADRYNLAKRVEAIRWWADSRYLAVIVPGGTRIVQEGNVSDERLVELIGKDAANRLVQAPVVNDGTSGDGYHELAGDGLTMGGEGMVAAYDHRLPSIARGIAKKFGATVGTTALDRRREDPVMQVHSLDITPELAAHALSGQDLRFAIDRDAPKKGPPELTLKDLEGAPEADAEESMQSNRGVKELGLWGKLRQRLAALNAAFRRRYIHLDSKTDGAVIATFRELEAAREGAALLAWRYVTSIVRDLNPAEVQAFERILILPDIVKDIEEGLYVDKPLPFGFADEAAVRRQLAFFEAKATPAVRAAIAARKDYQRALTQEMVDAGKLHPSVLADDRYYHRQVMAHLDPTEQHWSNWKPRDARDPKRGFQRKRSGGGSFNTSWVESEFEYVAQSLADLATINALGRFKEQVDIRDRLKAEAKAQNYENVVGGADNVARINTLRGLIRASWESADRGDSTQRMLRKGWNEELYELDPTASFRATIAANCGDLAKLAAGGEFDGSPWGQFLDEAVSEIDEDGRASLDMGHPDFWKFVSWVMANDAVSPKAKLHAGAIFNAIRDREKLIEKELGPRYVTWRDLAKDVKGYVIWQPEKGPLMFEAWTVGDRAMDEAMREVGIDPEAEGASDNMPDVLTVRTKGMRKAMVLGGRKAEWVIPERVARQLEQVGADIGAPDNPFAQSLSAVMAAWKQWTLINPLRVIRYTLNNLSGDVDVVLAGNPSALKEIPQAMKDVWAYLHGHKMAGPLESRLDDAAALGLLSSGMTLQEIPDISKVGIIAAMSGNKPGWITRYFGTVRNFQAWRESVFRIAAARAFYRQLAAKPDVRRYGASSKNEMDALYAEIDAMPKGDAKRRKEAVGRIAAKLARELVGDYGNTSSAGTWIARTLIPFWRWSEINLPRYARLVRNARYEGRSATGAGAVLAGGVVARGTIGLAARATAMYGMALVWNAGVKALMGIGDDEDPNRDRNRFFILMPFRDPDGRVVAVPFAGALADALSWMGLQDAAADVKEIATAEDKGKAFGEVLEDSLIAPVNKIGSGITPYITAPVAGAFGVQLFPDVRKPGVVYDQAEYWTRLLSVSQFYRVAKGKAKGGIVGELMDTVFYRFDPGERDYLETKASVAGFRSDLGKGGNRVRGQTLLEWIKGDPSAAKQAHLGRAKLAQKRDDGDAMRKHLADYFESGGSLNGWRQSQRMSDPLGALSKPDRKAYVESLSDRDKRQLARAQRWFADVLAIDNDESTDAIARKAWSEFGLRRKAEKAAPPAMPIDDEDEEIAPAPQRDDEEAVSP